MASRSDVVSGRFLLRLAPQLHAALRAAAAEQGISLNQYCARKLAAPIELGAAEMAGPVVDRAAHFFGRQLIGVVVFGSWSRGELTARSDVDLLVVVEPQVDLSRDLYRQWDRSPLTWDGRPIEPHFVHFPDRDHQIIGTWAEVAVDGIILFERHWRLSRRLGTIRRMIADGRLVRRAAHGQPYWTSVA